MSLGLSFTGIVKAATTAEVRRYGGVLVRRVLARRDSGWGWIGKVLVWLGSDLQGMLRNVWSLMEKIHERFEGSEKMTKGL